MFSKRRCSICGRQEGNPCVECYELFTVAPGLPHPNFLNSLPQSLDGLHAALIYEGAGRLLVSRLKFQATRTSVSWLSHAMATRAQAELVKADMATWAPTTRLHRYQRGFDHSRLLAQATARRLGVATQSVLSRRGIKSQTGLSAPERRKLAESPENVFALHSNVVGLKVLLIDDIATTGSTLAAAASVLRQGGAVSVVALVAAITPKTEGA